MDPVSFKFQFVYEMELKLTTKTETRRGTDALMDAQRRAYKHTCIVIYTHAHRDTLHSHVPMWPGCP